MARIADPDSRLDTWTDVLLRLAVWPLLVVWWAYLSVARNLAQVRADYRRDREQRRRLELLRLLRQADAAWKQLENAGVPTGVGNVVALRFRRLYFQARRLQATGESALVAGAMVALLTCVALPLVLLAPIRANGPSRGLFVVAALIGMVAILVALLRLDRFVSYVGVGVVSLTVFAGASTLLRQRWLVHWPTMQRGQRLADWTAWLVLLCGTVSAMVAMVLVMSLVLALVGLLAETRAMRKRPDIVALRALRTIVVLTAERASAFPSLRIRSWLIRELESLARAVERGYPRALSLPSPAERDAFGRRCAGLARAIRAHQLAVACPDLDTLPALRWMASQTLAAVCTGRFGSLAGSAPAELRRRRPWRSLLGAARLAVAAALPLCLAVVLLKYGVLARDTVGSTIVAACVLLPVVVVMTALDPLFKDRVSTIKELLSLWPGRKSG